ncbi:exosome non-catalytic core subunit rrp40 [Coemansia sp. RSA 2523]|nr:exosome non-catalytic core subunit rrp40 [Coemansia sp. RSA 1824]KAJ1804791.1 exosome non-catalytic core subunit rrp40 [Coemansia sp. RSA 2523]KAJ2123095.1 exosome non-catalytic core subunit rrp40 [Coemansia sp. RSA 921]KAJ2151556.1 exosome non-catalytic core subunit rrp40 [Coemansia sp. RSA 637]KAJ2153321.1 exosome non-catalytic core subunit rrp40 [Coemansia sp. RSA 560]KAJ2161758.1 exosome non-catalytic core subunit rrp40 [Coemansia sp. RSA 562]KAJ2182617.1 exosome non-catalytic core sub
MADVKVVVPGDVIDTHTEEDDAVLRLGPGLTQHAGKVSAVAAGVLHASPDTNHFWVVGNKRRYVPAEGEPVVGVVLGRHGEGYRVDIGSAHDALLPLLAFEGATRRNKPNLVVGATVYARVSVANEMMDPELECFNSHTGKSEGYGELTHGFTFKCSLGLARRLLSAKAPVLSALGEQVPFEAAVGVNGRVWVNAGTPEKTILVVNAIKNSEYLDTKQSKQMVRELLGKQ